MSFPTIVSSTTAYVAGGTTNTVNITLPASIAAGELIVIVASLRDTTAARALASAPSGFTVANSDDSTPDVLAVMHKVAVGNEGGTSVSITWNIFTGTVSLAAIAMRVTNVSITSPPIQAGANQSVSGATYIDYPSVTPTFIYPEQLVLAVGRIGVGAATSASAPSGYTQVAYVSTGGGASDHTLYAFYKNKIGTSAEEPANSNTNASASFQFGNTAIIEGRSGGTLFWAFP